MIRLLFECRLFQRKIVLLAATLLAMSGRLVAGGSGHLPDWYTDYSIFHAGNIPANPLNNDGQPLEFGVKIRATEPGLIRAIKFYKGYGSSGTHTGNIWTTSGALLASAVFVSESDSGWQQVLLSVPVAIDTGVTYVVSCFSASGDYGYTSSYFSTSFGAGPVKAIADGFDGGNGVYKYGATSVFPDQSYNASNYFVDVVFSPGVSGGILTGNSNYIPKFASPVELTNSLLFDNGFSIGLGTTQISDTSYRLYVEKGIRTRRVRVDHSSWPDYVFERNYPLLPLAELAEFVRINKRLPGIPSATEIARSGLDVGEHQGLLLKKVEELTLYIIQMQDEMARLRKELDIVRKQENNQP